MAKGPRSLIVDGSNAVHRIFGPFADQDEIQDYEEELARLLEEWAARHLESEVELVFDGGFRAVAGRGGRLRVIFADAGPADDVILERLRACRYAKRPVTIVTWDGPLARAAQAEEAKILDPERLWTWLRLGAT